MSDDNDQPRPAVLKTTVNGVEPTVAVEQGESIIQDMQQQGICEARFTDGTYFSQDASGTATVSTDGLMVIKKEHTTHLVFRNSGSTANEALEEVSSLSTQKVIGAFSGRSQPWVSDQLGLSIEDDHK